MFMRYHSPVREKDRIVPGSTLEEKEPFAGVGNRPLRLPTADPLPRVFSFRALIKETLSSTQYTLASCSHKGLNRTAMPNEPRIARAYCRYLSRHVVGRARPCGENRERTEQTPGAIDFPAGKFFEKSFPYIDRLGSTMLISSLYGKGKKKKKKKTRHQYGTVQYRSNMKAEFYMTKEWMELRYRVLKEKGRKCVCCGDEKGPFHVDHIKPRSRFPYLELNFDNLQVLCAPCNLGKGAWDKTDWAAVSNKPKAGKVVKRSSIL
jgi:5-methylcytosine-specific restriction endonuclease McrA